MRKLLLSLHLYTGLIAGIFLVLLSLTGSFMVCFAKILCALKIARSLPRRLSKPYARGEISFARIEEVRSELCPEASTYASIMNLTKLWPSPAIWLEARLARKKSEEDNGQGSFGFQRKNPPVLRAIHTAANAPAKELGLMIIPNFRVPTQSVIHGVFSNEQNSMSAREDLSLWCSSDGIRLPKCPVHVEAKRIGESIHALVRPAV
jgi:hypothetical protein